MKMKMIFLKVKFKKMVFFIIKLKMCYLYYYKV